jgi:hypothetical protein
MGDASVNCICVFNAIPSGELNTARRLYEDLRDIAASSATKFDARYFLLDSVASLSDAISALTRKAQTSGLRPWIHIDGHGDSKETGFYSSLGEFCSWDTLRRLVTPLNVATELNLLVILATCYGGSFAASITTIDRAPVLGLIGPTREVTAGSIEVDFSAFYKTFLSTWSMNSALRQLRSTSNRQLYYATNAVAFFYAVWAGYKRNSCTRRAISERASRIRRNLVDSGHGRPPSVGNLKRQLKRTERDEFDKYVDVYFLNDLIPKNRSRFVVTYEQAEAQCER